MYTNISEHVYKLFTNRNSFFPYNGLVSSFPLCTAPVIPQAASHHVTL